MRFYEYLLTAFLAWCALSVMLGVILARWLKQQRRHRSRRWERSRHQPPVLRRRAF